MEFERFMSVLFLKFCNAWVWRKNAQNSLGCKRKCDPIAQIQSIDPNPIVHLGTCSENGPNEFIETWLLPLSPVFRRACQVLELAFIFGKAVGVEELEILLE